jgi:hypothetical protein
LLGTIETGTKFLLTTRLNNVVPNDLKDLRLATTGTDDWARDQVQECASLVMLIKLQVEHSIPLFPVI